ncbi:hypothetical protein RIF29_22015 [Crotalaria pallida]|uniref:Uncharacterized protein n=1 Tax=Crotalaria pallida TaxID=3830 RepID=A0AAN9F3V8_CROPI
MDQRELHLQHLGICYKLYHFITKTLASQALKTVTLGHTQHDSSSSSASRGSGSKAGKEEQIETPSEDYGNKELQQTQGDSISSLAGQAEKKDNPSVNMGSLPQAKPPKKMVSINENVEEIVPSKKKRRSRSFQRSSSQDQNEGEEEPKPLRSILKVGSDLNVKSNSIR